MGVTFNQQGQHVTYQYNAETINFGAVQNRIDAIGQLEQLQQEFSRAVKANVFNEETAADAEHQLKKAVIQAKKPQPDKKTMLEHLTEAKTLIEGVAAAGGLVKGLIEAADVVRNFF